MVCDITGYHMHVLCHHPANELGMHALHANMRHGHAKLTPESIPFTHVSGGAAGSMH